MHRKMINFYLYFSFLHLETKFMTNALTNMRLNLLSNEKPKQVVVLLLSDAGQLFLVTITG